MENRDNVNPATDYNNRQTTVENRDLSTADNIGGASGDSRQQVVLNRNDNLALVDNLATAENRDIVENRNLEPVDNSDIATVDDLSTVAVDIVDMIRDGVRVINGGDVFEIGGAGVQMEVEGLAVDMGSETVDMAVNGVDTDNTVDIAVVNDTSATDVIVDDIENKFT